MDTLREELAREGWAWFLFGLAGQLTFQGRFYLQWIASERKKKSVIPVAFWYLSCVGTLMLLVFAVYTQSPVGALSNGLNIVIYARNLVHIWRNAGKLTKQMHTAIHGIVAVIALVAVYFVARVWLLEYDITKHASAGEAQKTWFWIAVGATGTLLFGCRFIIQWIATERARASVIPTAFWYFSVVATVLQFIGYIPRKEWVFALGSVMGIVIYARNLWFIHKPGAEVDDPEAMS
ncbi:MAG: lipid-A-disaccharide synthase N-terminal domain-containing protein [Candidatus Hydrogenedentes bacterium]|nr:lipid-A-disaccharide synthase N-terminal domain-containing protein [Candidatus Hydrogenedentota bacterium]